MTKSRIALGRLGEDLAADYLRKQAYIILNRNYRTARGEIDLVAKDGETLVFIEVKTRKSTAFGTPLEAITRQKQVKLRELALTYMQEQHVGASGIRFDAIAISCRYGKAPEIVHLRNAF